jgi:hypothetical protein
MALFRRKIENVKLHIFSSHSLLHTYKMQSNLEEEKKQFNTMIDTMYHATTNAACVLKTKDSERFFHALTSWCLEHLVGCYEKDGKWYNVEWQESMIRGYHLHWTGVEYKEDDE